jgi:hypothetical protein
MGYNSEIIPELRVNPALFEEFKHAVKKRTEAPARKRDDDLVDCFFGDMEIGHEGRLEWDEIYGKHYGDEEFAQFIAPFVEQGYLRFLGEDGERWGYWFDGNGGVKRLRYVEEIENEYFYRHEPENQGGNELNLSEVSINGRTSL